MPKRAKKQQLFLCQAELVEAGAPLQTRLRQAQAGNVKIEF
jgi:hypothetical protein